MYPWPKNFLGRRELHSRQTTEVAVRYFVTSQLDRCYVTWGGEWEFTVSDTSRNDLVTRVWWRSLALSWGLQLLYRHCFNVVVVTSGVLLLEIWNFFPRDSVIEIFNIHALQWSSHIIFCACYGGPFYNVKGYSQWCRLMDGNSEWMVTVKCLSVSGLVLYLQNVANLVSVLTPYFKYIRPHWWQWVFFIGHRPKNRWIYMGSPCQFIYLKGLLCYAGLLTGALH